MDRTAARTNLITVVPVGMRVATSMAVAGYPSLRAAAKIVGVNASTLSRRGDLRLERAGQEKRVPAAEVIRIGADYKKRDLSRVAAMLNEHAYSQSIVVREAVSEEVQAALRVYDPEVDFSEDARRFLEDAHRLLPAALAKQVESSLAREPVDDELGGMSGWVPDED